MTGSPDGDRLITEALVLGQALDADAARLARLFEHRGLHLYRTSRRAEAVASLRQAVLFAEQAGDNHRVGHVLLNLSDVIASTDPAAAAEAARTAAEHLRQAGDRLSFTFAIGISSGHC